MKAKLLILFLLVSVSVSAQVESQFNGSILITGISNSQNSDVRIQGLFGDPRGLYQSRDMRVGNLLIIAKGNECGEYQLADINSESGLIDLELIDIDQFGLPDGSEAIISAQRESRKVISLPPSGLAPSGVSASLLACAAERLGYQVDTITSGGFDGIVYDTSYIEGNNFVIETSDGERDESELPMMEGGMNYTFSSGLSEENGAVRLDYLTLPETNETNENSTIVVRNGESEERITIENLLKSNPKRQEFPNNRSATVQVGETFIYSKNNTIGLPYGVVGTKE